MKKNIALRLASGLMLSCLLSTCVISGTFAKYTTSDSAFDTARVAKWGVTVDATGTMFAETYGDTVATSVSEEKIVAPGTDGALASVTVVGTPEVDVTVTYTADLVLTGWKLEDNSEYCPIKIKVGDTEFTCTGTLAEFETAVEGAIASVSQTYQANQNLNQVNDDLIVTWVWDYFTSNDNDQKDTYLGDQAAVGNASTIKLTVTTTITQVD